MGHIRKESAFRLVCPVGLHQGILQKVFLLHLVPDFLIHAAEAQNHSMVPVPLPGAHHLHLVILHLPIFRHAVVYVILLIFRQLFFQPLPGKCLPQHIPVFLIDKVPYVRLHPAFQGNFARESFPKHMCAVLVYPQNLSLPRVQFKTKHQVIINAQRLDKLRLLPFAFHAFLIFLLLLGRAV